MEWMKIIIGKMFEITNLLKSELYKAHIPA